MTFEFRIGDRVRFIAGEDIDGIVTSYLVRSGDHVSYEVTWFHNGEVKSRWTDKVEIRMFTPNGGLKDLK